eukprot:6655864-Alexandrium_andersonii.AAC.1
MSASLVGSEMCIRDRSKQPFSDVPQAAIAMGEAIEDLKGEPITFPTVSYTHLTLPTICSV